MTRRRCRGPDDRTADLEPETQAGLLRVRTRALSGIGLTAAAKRQTARLLSDPLLPARGGSAADTNRVARAVARHSGRDGHGSHRVSALSGRRDSRSLPQSPVAGRARDGFSIVRSAVYPAPNRGFYRRLADHGAFGLSALATARLSGPATWSSPRRRRCSPPRPRSPMRGQTGSLVVNVADRWPATRWRSAPCATAGRSRRRRRSSVDLPARRSGRRPDRGNRRRRSSGNPRRPGGRGESGPWSTSTASIRRPRAPGGSEPAGAAVRGHDRARARTRGARRGLPAGRTGVVRTTIAGDGADAARIRDADRRAADERSDARNRRRRTDPALYADADAAAVLIRDLAIFRGALPTKMFEAMAAGRPSSSPLGARRPSS